MNIGSVQTLPPQPQAIRLEAKLLAAAVLGILAMAASCEPPPKTPIPACPCGDAGAEGFPRVLMVQR